MLIFIMAIFLLLLSRVTELRTSNRHEVVLCQDHGAVLLKAGEYQQIVLFHSAWFVMLIIEGLWRNELVASPLSLLFVFFLLGAQVLRWWSIQCLGIYWTAKIYRCMPLHPVIRKGPYRWLMHPSYIAVMLEFIFFPWLFHCYWTMIIFIPFKVFLLIRRIRLEQKILGRYI